MYKRIKCMNVDEKRICAEIWESHEPLIRKICSIKLKSSPNEIDDVVSDVFLALCKQVSESGAPEKPREWLCGTLRNMLNKKYTAIYKIRENETSLSDEEFRLPLNNDDINRKENEIYIEELMKLFDNKLNDSDLELLDYIFNHGLKSKKIAVLKNTTEAAIKQKRYRLYLKLRKIVRK